MVDHKSPSLSDQDIDTHSHEKDHTSSWHQKKQNISTSMNRKRHQHFVCVPPELLEASIIDDAKYYSEQYLQHQDVFASNNENKKANQKKWLMSKWVTKIEYHRCHKQPQSDLILSRPLSAEDLYHEIYPKNIQLYKLKILLFLDPNTFNKDHKHNINVPDAYRKYTRCSGRNRHDNDIKFGDVHITYLPAARARRDRYHTSLDYAGYHYCYKLYDYVSLRKYNGVQHVAETCFYKQKIARAGHGYHRHKHQYVLKKEVLDLQASEHDKYAAFLLAFVWNLFSVFEQCCETDGQWRKSIKFKICKKMSNVLNECHFPQFHGNSAAMVMHRKRMMNHHAKQKNVHSKNDMNVEFERKTDDSHSDSGSVSRSLSSGPSYTECHDNRGPLKMEMW